MSRNCTGSANTLKHFVGRSSGTWPSSPGDFTPSLPVYVFTYAVSPYEDWHRQAWAGRSNLARDGHEQISHHDNVSWYIYMKAVLFVCVHNAGRSQMAEAFTNKLAADRGLPIRGLSAGTEAAERVNPLAVEAMRELGISMEGQSPKQLTQEMADSASRIITMGCGVDATSCPARIHLSEDWGLDDPAGKPIEKVREVRDQIRERVEAMLSEMQGAEQMP